MSFQGICSIRNFSSKLLFLLHVICVASSWLIGMIKLIFLGTILEIWNDEIIDNLHSSTG